MTFRSGAPGPGEFDLIARYFAPLSAGAPGAFGLTDDAAEISAGGPLVVSCDAIVEGVHFLSTDPLDTVARKALRVNLSDLAAKGCAPIGWLLALSWPRGRDTTDIADLAAGFAADVAEYGAPLLGGDTVSTPGPLTLAVTVLGAPGPRGMIRRSGACPGDLVCLTGTLGDGTLGLDAARAPASANITAAAVYLADRYRLPQPRLDLARAIATHATAALDVSDGLVADAGHMARASGLGIDIDTSRLPLSDAAGAWLATQPSRNDGLVRLMTGGDDYEVLFTIPPSALGAITTGATTPITVIGRCVEGSGVTAIADGAPLTIPQRGWAHF